MYKIYAKNRGVLKKYARKTMLIMRLTTIILIATMMQVSASTFAQKISLSKSNASLKTVLKDIRIQSGYDFVYTEGILKAAKPVSIKVNMQNLEAVLEEIFSTQPLIYTVNKNTITIKEREKTLIDRIISVFAKYDIRGKITDVNGNPLTGASVLLKKDGATGGIAVVTDEYGDYKFVSLEEGTYNITISYVGYTTQKLMVGINGKDVTLNVKMVNAITDLQTVNVVNTGYQLISTERMTGAFDNIKKGQLDKPTTNIAERLIGSVAGMQVKLDVNNNPSIKVRGQTTLNANSQQGFNTPLIVIDGFAQSTTSSNPFNTINPNDVEDITILKDAAAASIWGARSANGVIVITTKKGSKNSALKVDASFFTRFSDKQDVRYMTGSASSAETVDYEQLAFKKWGGRVNSGTIFDNFKATGANTLLNENNLGYITSAQLNAGLAQLKTQDNRGQISDYLLSNPVNTQYNLSLSGGNQRMTNLVSMLFEENQSNFKGSGNKKYSINYRTNANVFKWLDFDFSGTFQYDKANNNGMQVFDIQQLGPYQLLKNPDGSLTDVFQYYQPTMLRLVPLSKFPYAFNYNPIQEVENRDATSTNKNARIQAGLTTKILQGLTFRSSIQYENADNSNRNYRNEKTFYVRDLVNTSSTWNQTLAGTVTRNLPLGGILQQDRTGVEAYNFRNQFNFSKTFAAHHEINVVGGTEMSRTVSQVYSYPTTYGYDDLTLSVGSFPNGVTGTRGWTNSSNNFNYLSSFNYRTQRFFSMFTNAAYTYDGKYTLSGSYRTDASNLIASDPKYRYSPFFSGGIAYAISKENFMKGLTWLDRLNLRATYGRTGNVDNSSSPFTLIVQQPADRYTNDLTARLGSLGNPTLTWEKTETLNMGLDFSVLNSKLYGKVDVYNKKGKDLLASISIPTVLGASSSRFNNAGMYNKGIEVTMGTTLPLKENDILWNGNFNFSYNKSKITKLINSTYDVNGLVGGGSLSYSEGNDPNSAWAYQYAGVVNGNPMIKGANGTLLPLNSFLSGDGRGYLQNMGTKDPRYILGFSNSFKVYDFNVSFIIIAKFGAVFQGQYFNYPVAGSITYPNAQLAKVINGDPNLIATLPTDPNNTGYSSWISTNRFLNYSYLSADLARLQEVNLSYTLPRSWLSKINFSTAQIILQGNNLYTWLANDTGEDPEYRIGNVKPRAQFTLGIKFQL